MKAHINSDLNKNNPLLTRQEEKALEITKA